MSQNEEPKKFNKIEAEQLNIVDKNGKVKLSLFNQDHIPPAIMDGVDILPGHRQNDPISGLMFYNSDGDECGGLIYGNEIKEDGSYEAGASLTFDQYKQDQVVQMSYNDRNGERSYGFSVYDRPEQGLKETIEKQEEIKKSNLSDDEKDEATKQLFEGNVPRAQMGKSTKGDVSVKLMDSKGNQRIRMVVDEHDVPKIEFLDEKGNVTYRLPPKE
ncbi:hypothetical protein [Alkalibacillus haloalkaliphilus]|uniref:Uncharacterized protein n=1 Tax=Alkalibacillus haloalkaliphilus TaxID=94136 RepID=A0A511W9U7_9BACI|nr:hypothetical protein [Alkalibacillus haloalkaliphilus]GEN46853.1 hypothetical protein AHA02nite_26290 [Alkalibacillus haloalkaliphilus]